MLLRDSYQNKWAGTKNHGTARQQDGSVKISGTPTNRKKGIVKEYGARFDVWEIVEEKNSKKYKHPAMFPEKLAHDHIVSWSNEGDTVLDPFMGSGTTGKQAKLLKRDFIGIEKVEEYYQMAVNRLSK